jgi:two-component system sensor histidine kinase PilS (NtrC family)
LLDKDLKLEGTDKKLMEIILRGREQLENLIRDFLLLARPGSEDCNVMDVGEIIDDILESIRFGADWNENVRIMKKLCDRNKVYGNRTEIRQAILNVVLNAFQSMPEGGSLKIETEMTENEDGNSLFKISICDTGYGIEKLRLLKVKEPFYTTREKGTGLGLAIVNRIVESHKGRFDIESEPDKGTKCTISLPAGPFETDPAKIAL